MRSRVVLFGGGSFGMLSDTWEWDGNSWTQRTPTLSPPPRSGHGHALAYDGARGRAVLFGGTIGLSSYASDTWEWDGNTWSQLTPAASPSARTLHALAYDSARGRVVIFGGATSLSSVFSDTWEWDGSTWTQRIGASHPGRIYHALAYDTARGRLVCFGGANSGGNFSDTWDYGPINPARYLAFGVGCSGSAGVPALITSEGQLPWIARTFRVDLTNLPANAPAILLLGGSKVSWGPIALPFSLGGIGMTGCTLYASGEVILPVQTSGLFSSAMLPVPNNAALVGGSFFNQGIVLDPLANAAGATASNAGEGRIGAK